MAGCGDFDVDQQWLSSMSIQEQGHRNKRKHLAECSLDVPVDLSSLPLVESPGYELLAEKFQATLSNHGSSQASCHQHKQEQVEQFHPSEWDDPIVCQLEELLLHNLSAIFQSAIKKIAECGYSKEVAEQAVLRSATRYGTKDRVSNIIGNALNSLRENESETSEGHAFTDLQKLVQYTMVEMIYVIRELKPSLTVAEAMWCLLICDLNLSNACAMVGDLLNGIVGKEIPAECSPDSTLSQLKSEASETCPSSPSKSHDSKPSTPNAQDSRLDDSTVGHISQFHEVKTTEKEYPVPASDVGIQSLGITGEYVHNMSRATVVEEKSGGSKKGSLGNSKRDMLRQKAFHFEKSYKGRMPKGAFKAKFTTLGGLVLDKKLKSPCDASGVNMKNPCSKTDVAIGADASPATGSHHSSVNPSSIQPPTGTPATFPTKVTVSALPTPNAKLPMPPSPKTRPTPKAQVTDPNSFKVPDYYAGIPYNETLGKYVSQNDRDEMILTLVPQLQALQKELQGWTDWANEKVMQAARMLSKDQAELKTLRQEKEEAEKFKKEKQNLEENTMKRLSEMEHALSNTAGQIEMANSTVRRLEMENSMLKKEMEAARVQAVGSAANLEEALLREQEALKNSQLWDIQKGLMQEEINSVRDNLAELQQQLEKARGVENKIEAQWKHEKSEKERLLIEASSLRSERECLEVHAKAEEDMIRQNAESEMQEYKEGIKKLETRLSELRLESESSKIAALRRGIDLTHGGGTTESKSTPSLQGYQAPSISKGLAVFRDNFGAGSIKQERECVMCLTEEISIVFLPCAHQVLCAKCDVLHEKQGMKDCPSCRTPIQQRINARFVSS